MGGTPLPHVFEDTLLSVDGWESNIEILNPSTESVDLAIADREDMLEKNSGVDGDGNQWMGFFRNLSGNQFETQLSVFTSVSYPKKPEDELVLSFLNSDVVYVLDKGTLFDKNAIKNIIVRFLDGDDMTQFLPFDAISKDSASKYRFSVIDEASGKLNSKK